MRSWFLCMFQWVGGSSCGMDERRRQLRPWSCNKSFDLIFGRFEIDEQQSEVTALSWPI